MYSVKISRRKGYVDYLSFLQKYHLQFSSMKVLRWAAKVLSLKPKSANIIILLEQIGSFNENSRYTLN